MIAINMMDVRQHSTIREGEVTYTWCSKHLDRTRHLWTGHKLICLEAGCHPELDPDLEKEG